MVTAVDTNIFLDVLVGSESEASEALRALTCAFEQGSLVCSCVCYAELANRFPQQSGLDGFLFDLGCKVVVSSLESAFIAGRFHHNYRKRGGKRTRIVADFFIAADAQLNADRLLTRDDRFFKGEFPDLAAVDPATLLTS